MRCEDLFVCEEDHLRTDEVFAKVNFRTELLSSDVFLSVDTALIKRVVEEDLRVQVTLKKRKTEAEVKVRLVVQANQLV